MLEKKIKEYVVEKIMIAGIASLLSACGGGICMEPEYGVKSAAEIQASSNTYIVGAGTNSGTYATASCRDECTYNSKSDCCWCPD